MTVSMQNLLIDTNILVLLVIGSIDPKRIRTHRRTNTFTPDDFKLLQAEMRKFRRLVTTTPIMTEVSNLMGKREHEDVAAQLIQVCSPFEEMAHAKEVIFAADVFARLGFADTSILLALDDRTTLLTDDASLYFQALYDGKQAINFNHLRRFGNP